MLEASAQPDTIDRPLAMAVRQTLDRWRGTVDLAGPAPAAPATRSTGTTFIVASGAVEPLEALARDRARRLFGAEYASLRAGSAHAAVARVVDTMLALDDGVVTIGTDVLAPRSDSPRYRRIVFDPDGETGRLDYEALASQVQDQRPRLIVAGQPPHARAIGWRALRAIADTVDAGLVVDAGVGLGGIAAGVYPNPLDHAHVMCGDSQGLARESRFGLMLVGADAGLADRLRRAVSEQTSEAPSFAQAEALAGELGRAATPKVVQARKRARAHAATMVRLLRGRAFDVLSGGTDDHRFVVDLRRQALTARRAVAVLNTIHVAVRGASLPGAIDGSCTPAGLVIDTTAIGDRGFDAAAARQLAAAMADVLEAANDDAVALRARRQVRALCERYPRLGTDNERPGHGS